MSPDYSVTDVSGLYRSGMPSNTVRLLQRARTFTQARQCGAGWFASDRAEAGGAWYYQCAPQLRRAVAYCPVVMVYREGAPLWRDRPDLRDTAGEVLRSLGATPPDVRNTTRPEAK